MGAERPPEAKAARLEPGLREARERLSVQQEAGEKRGRGQGWSDEQVSLAEGRVPPPEGDGSLGDSDKRAGLHQVHVLESSLWLQ